MEIEHRHASLKLTQTRVLQPGKLAKAILVLALVLGLFSCSQSVGGDNSDGGESEEETVIMSEKYGFDIVDGREVPRLVVRGDYTLTGVHRGGVHVENGCLGLAGTHYGSLDIQSGTRAEIEGDQYGSVSVARGATVTVTGSIHGSAYISSGGNLVVEPSGRLAGSLSNWGCVIIRGVFGGSYDGNGQFKLEEDGYVKEPEVRDGVNYYNW